MVLRGGPRVMAGAARREGGAKGDEPLRMGSAAAGEEGPRGGRDAPQGRDAAVVLSLGDAVARRTRGAHPRVRRDGRGGRRTGSLVSEREAVAGSAPGSVSTLKDPARILFNRLRPAPRWATGWTAPGPRERGSGASRDRTALAGSAPAG